MQTVWSAESGFQGEQRPVRCEPLIVKNGDMVHFDWENLHGDLEERCAAADVWFPKRIQERSLIFPIPMHDEKFYEHFFNSDALLFAKQFILANTMVPFKIPTPSLYCMLVGSRHPESILSTDVALLYLVVIFNLSPPEGSAPGMQPSQIIEMMQSLGDREANPLAAALFSNLMRSGMMQHYFMADRHADAPDWLCRLFAMYTLRMMQVLERQVLRLSPLGYVENESAQMAMSTVQSNDTTGVTAGCVQLYQLQMVDDHFEKPENRPAEMTALPSLEEIKESNFLHGINVKYAESVLWYLQARLRFPPPMTEEPKPLPEETKSPEEAVPLEESTTLVSE